MRPMEVDSPWLDSNRIHAILWQMRLFTGGSRWSNPAALPLDHVAGWLLEGRCFRPGEPVRRAEDEDGGSRCSCQL
jgi:hypothetical protein